MIYKKCYKIIFILFIVNMESVILKHNAYNENNNIYNENNLRQIVGEKE